MTPEEAAARPKVPIGPPIPRKFELRVIIWCVFVIWLFCVVTKVFRNTKDVAFRDKVCDDVIISLIAADYERYLRRRLS